MNVAVSFEKRLVAQQGLSTFVSFVSLAGFVPPILRPEESSVVELVVRVLGMGVLAAVFVAALTSLTFRRHRFTLRALALGSKAIELHEIDGLRRLPSRMISIKWLVESVAIVIAAALRPAQVSGEVARELVLLGLMTTLATSVPALVLTQTAMARLLEIAPLEIVAAHLEEIAERAEPRRLSRRNLTLAVVIPVSLVGVGGGLASFAHLRAMTEDNRVETAQVVGRAISAGETRDHVGQKAAIEAARRLGYRVRFTDDEPSEQLTRVENDDLLLSLPLERGSVTVTFPTEVGFQAALPLALVAIGFAFFALLAAHSLAGLVSRDLSRATERLKTLGTDAVLRGGRDDRIEARFEAAFDLARAALALAERFRVFAAAQERALEAKEIARRMRGLFFASVSHDLKSPLNAILGFADSIDRSALTPSQHESLDLIATRGRELVALIETILDAARVEAGQLRLNRRTMQVASWLAGAAKLGRELAQESGELKVEIGEGLPPTDVDPVHLPRALAVVIAHALRSTTHDGAPARVIVRASLPARERRIRIEIDHGNTTVTTDELSALFARQSSSRGRGLTLGLSLAKSVFELHAGAVEVQGEPSGRPVVLAYVPISASVPPPTSKP